MNLKGKLEMKMRSVFIAICGGLLTGGFALSGASAAIVGTSGDLTLVAQPASLVYTGVAQVQSVSPSLAGLGPVIFSEFSGRMVPDFTSISPTLTGFDGIDISTSGRFPTDPLVGTQVLTGQTMDSFIIHFDPNEYSGSVVYSASGSVVFDRPIFGVQTTFTLLREGLLDLPNIQLFGSSGLELYDDPQVGDQLTLSSDLKTLSFAFRTSGATEDLRIYFNSVPEPDTLILVMFGLLGLQFLRRQKMLNWRVDLQKPEGFGRR